MVRRLSVFIFFCFSLYRYSYAQNDSVQINAQLLSNEVVGNLNFDEKTFESHVEEALEALERFFSNWQRDHEVIVLETLYPDRRPRYDVHARPAMFIPHMDNLVSKLEKLKGPKSLYVKYYIAYIIKINSGCPDQHAGYVPEFKVPVQKAYDALQTGSLSNRSQLIKQWAQREALPILAAYELEEDPKYEGVRAIGALVRALDMSTNPDIAALTEGNADYWKALLEMPPGNQAIASSKLFMHVAKGEFDIAAKYLEALSAFSDSNSLEGYYMGELKWRLEAFQQELTAQINGGIMMHDANKYGEAIKTYNRILKEYPNSAWAMFELYYSRNTLKMYRKEGDADDRADWDASKEKIFHANPLYNMDIRPNTRHESYHMYRRAEIGKLFKIKEDFVQDFIALADIALDLEVYGFAAHVYWLVLSSVPKDQYNERDLLPYFLYCLDKLGEKEIKKNFQGDVEAEFKRITEERDTLMRENPAYMDFKDKE